MRKPLISAENRYFYNSKLFFHARNSLVVTAFISSAALAQSVIIKSVELAGELVIVHYELDDSNLTTSISINLMHRRNYSTALAKVTGDVGNG